MIDTVNLPLEEEATAICYILLDKIKQTVSEVAQVESATINKFTGDMLNLITEEDREKAKPLVAHIVVLGLLKELCQTLLEDVSDLLTESIPDEKEHTIN